MPPVVAAVAGASLVVGGSLAAGGLAAAFTSTALVGTLAKLGATLLISTATRALMPTPQVQTRPRTQTIREPVSPRDLVYGRSRKGGTLVFIETTGKKSKELHMVIAFASHRVRSIGAIFFDGEKAFEADGTPTGRYVETAGGIVTQRHAEVHKRLGDPDQDAIPEMIDRLPGLWTSEHRLRGIAHVYLRLTHKLKVFPNGIPNVTADIEGKDDILDPRSATRGYSENAALCLADYLSLPEFGLNAAIGAEHGVDADELIAAANVCDEDVPLATGGSEPRYACNGVITLSETPKTIIEGLLSAMAGTLATPGEAFRIFPGAWRPPALALGDDDVREGGLSLATRVSRADNFNGVRGQFVSPENDWQADDFPAVTSDSYLAEDGGERAWRDIVLPFTISPAAAQRLAKIELERTRRQQTLRWTGRLTALRAGIGGTAAVTRARWGFAAKPFEIRGVSIEIAAEEDGPRLLPELTLRETSPLVFDWDASEAQIYAAAPRTSLPSAFDVEPPGVPVLSEALFVTRDGAGVRALLRAEWEPAGTGIVTGYLVEARRAAEPDGTPTGEDWQARGTTGQTFLEIRDVAPGLWELRVASLSAIGVESAWRTASLELRASLAAPSALTGLGIQTAGGIAILRWEPAADLDVRIGGRILIRHSEQASGIWANSTRLDEVPGGTGLAAVPLKPGAYLLRARDSTGNVGPVALVPSDGAQALAFAPLAALVADPVFAGTKTGLAVDAGTLTLVDPAVPGLYAFAAGLDFGSPRAIRLRSEIRLSAIAIGTGIDDRTEPIDTWADFDGTDGAEVDAAIEVRLTGDDPAASPAWSDWARVDSSETRARAIEARARIASGSGDFNVAVSRLRLHAEEVA